MTTPLPMEGGEDPYLDFAYHGFHGVVRRFCRLTVLGWAITVVGAGWLIVSGTIRGEGGLAEILLASSVVVAGVAVVTINVGALETYVQIPFPAPPDHPRAGRLGELLREVREGGWRDACAVRRRLERLEADEGFPPLR